MKTITVTFTEDELGAVQQALEFDLDAVDRAGERFPDEKTLIADALQRVEKCALETGAPEPEDELDNELRLALLSLTRTKLKGTIIDGRAALLRLGMKRSDVEQDLYNEWKEAANDLGF